MLNTFKYDNGLRLIHHSSPTNVAYCGIAIDAGSRDEYSHEHGIAHFCEHALFKGTIHRNSWHILNRMEAVGGDLNAFTTKEDTVVYSAFIKDHFKRAVESFVTVIGGVQRVCIGILAPFVGYILHLDGSARNSVI